LIRPCTLRDLYLVGQPKEHVVLCPIEALTRPQLPLWAALTSMLPLTDGQSLTIVLDEQRRHGKPSRGFVQAEQSLARKTVYIQRLMPALDADKDATAIWTRLINHAATVAAQRGIQRMVSCAIEGSPEMAALASAGLNQYTREDIYRLPPDTHPQVVAPPGIRPEQSVDQWNISQLYRQVTPRLVQQAESPDGEITGDRLCGPQGWGQGEGFCLEDRQGIAGYGYLRSGRVGHWLSVLVHPRAAERTGELLDYGLALLNYYPPYPVYCGVREYQGGVRVPLAQRGFTFFSSQCLLVRHLLIRVKEPARGLVPALEKRVEAPTTTVSPTEQTLDQGAH
jgi:hypothetical protein